MSYVTTIVPCFPLSQDPTLLCSAHQRGIRVSLLAEDFPMANLSDPARRTAWANRQVRCWCVLWLW